MPYLKASLLVLIFVMVSFAGIAQTTAITSNGDEIIVYTDGTWKYADKGVAEAKEIKLNNGVFKKDAAQTFPLKSKLIKATVNLNPKKWSFKNRESTEESAEYNFTHKIGEAYAMLVSEKLDVTMEGLADIAFQNAKEASPDITVDVKEYRMVNGTKMVFMRMSGTVSSMKACYLGYYASQNGECFQLLGYCSTAQLPTMQKEIEEFLNGMSFSN